MRTEQGKKTHKAVFVAALIQEHKAVGMAAGELSAGTAQGNSA